MRKLKLRWFLPVVFLGFSAIVLAWSQPIDKLLQPARQFIGSVADLWHALNAPALFLVAIAIHYAPLRVSGGFDNVPVEALLFLISGLIVWFLIGARLDAWKEPTRSPSPSKTLGLLQVLVIGWGIYLCWQGLHALVANDYLGRHLPGSLFNGAMVILWSLLLVSLPSKSLVHALKSRAKNADQGGAAGNR
jgi:hypothetical protein